MQVPVEESGFPVAQTGSSAGIFYSWLWGWSLTGKSSVFLSPSCLKQVKAGPLPSPSLPVLLFTSPTWQISIPPLQLPFSSVDICTHTDTPLLLFCWGSTGNILFRLRTLPPWFHACMGSICMCSTTHSISGEGKQTHAQTEPTCLATSGYFCYGMMCSHQCSLQIAQTKQNWPNRLCGTFDCFVQLSV